MQKTISASELKANAEALVEAVNSQGDCFDIEVEGQGAAALVPLASLTSGQGELDQLAKLADAMAGRAGLSEDEAMQLALEEVAAHRTEKWATRAVGGK